MKAIHSEPEITKKICFLHDEHEVENIIKELTGQLGFPEVDKILTLYFKENIRLRCDANKVYVGRKISTKSGTSWKEFTLSSRFLGSVINVLVGAGLTSAAISSVQQLSFPADSAQVMYLRGTLIAEHQFDISFTVGQKHLKKIVKYLIDRSAEEGEIKRRKSRDAEEPVLDRLGVANEKIVDFCKQTNISLNQTVQTSYYHGLSSVSNDYTEMAKVFELITGQKITSPQPTPHIYSRYLPSASIVIPAYNTEGSIVKTLESIDKQIPSDIKFEVIVVDDGSTTPVKTAVDKISPQLSFQPIVVRKEKNSGIAQTRNIGATIANNDILVFIDGDIVLTQNYLYEHLLRHKVLRKAVLVSFKENVDMGDPRISDSSIGRGVPQPDYRNDLRITKYLDKDTMGYYPDNYLADGDVFSILTETDYFKSLGYGRRIGVFDLPSMVVGHNFTLPRKYFHEIGGFDSTLDGYGLEDSYIGIKAISSGAFVVPILSCGVYHIDHPTRRGDIDQLRKEFECNSEKIASFLSSHE